MERIILARGKLSATVLCSILQVSKLTCFPMMAIHVIRGGGSWTAAIDSEPGVERGHQIIISSLKVFAAMDFKKLMSEGPTH